MAKVTKKSEPKPGGPRWHVGDRETNTREGARNLKRGKAK